MRSEYNYEKKKNFVELLNKPSMNGGSGLAAINLGQQVVNNDDDGNFRRDKHHGRLFSERPSVRFKSVTKVRDDQPNYTQEPVDEQDELLEDEGPRPMLTQNISK